MGFKALSKRRITTERNYNRKSRFLKKVGLFFENIALRYCSLHECGRFQSKSNFRCKIKTTVCVVRKKVYFSFEISNGFWCVCVEALFCFCWSGDPTIRVKGPRQEHYIDQTRSTNGFELKNRNSRILYTFYFKFPMHPSEHTISFQRCSNVVDVQTTLLQRQNDVVCLLGYW